MSFRVAWNKCSECGQFISMDDLDSGKAKATFHEDWNYCHEDIEQWADYTCRNCLEKVKENESNN